MIGADELAHRIGSAELRSVLYMHEQVHTLIR
jgi:hypothetical protein